MDIASMFADMDTAQGSSSGEFFTQGNYKVELKEVEFRPNGYKGKSVIFRFKVLESNNTQHPVGCTRVWICKLDKKPDENKRTMADIKNLVFALIGTSVKEVGSPETNPDGHQQATSFFLAACDRAYAEKHNIDHNLLIGQECLLEASVKKATQPGKSDFTRHIWEPLSDS